MAGVPIKGREEDVNVISTTDIQMVCAADCCGDARCDLMNGTSSKAVEVSLKGE